MRQLVKRWFHILTDPHDAFAKLRTRTFEAVLYEYLQLLLMVAVAAGIFLLLTSLGKALYYDAFRHVDITYIRLLNYGAGAMTALLFFYFFAGTFLLFLVSLLLQPFLRLKYTRTLQAIFYALAPVLLFGWIVPLIGGLLLWSLVLLYAGTAVLRKQERTRKGSLRER